MEWKERFGVLTKSLLILNRSHARGYGLESSRSIAYSEPQTIWCPCDPCSDFCPICSQSVTEIVHPSSLPSDITALNGSDTFPQRTSPWYRLTFSCHYMSRLPPLFCTLVAGWRLSWARTRGRVLHGHHRRVAKVTKRTR